MTTEAYINPNRELKKRYQKTISFFDKQNFGPEKNILDIGSENPFTQIIKDKGFNVQNTGEVDLDINPEMVRNFNVDIVLALEILEHLVSPFPLLRNLPGEKLVATVPLRLWFKNAYKNPNDPWDRHFHEFEDWQFDWLLQKSGWKITHREKWISSTKKIGFRPILRKFTYRYYAVCAERVK